MGAQDRTERVLRDIHVLFSKAESYNGSKRDVIVNKIEMMDLLKELNACMYDMMEEYELTKAKKDKANREMQKEGEDMLLDYKGKAEDVYASSIMYADGAMRDVQDILRETEASVEKIYNDAKKRMDEELRTIKDNQLELKSSLENLIDTQKYLRLVEDENRRREKEKTLGKETAEAIHEETFEKVTPVIHVNEEYFRQNGIPLEGEEETSETSDARESGETAELSEEAIEALSDELDQEYFDWKDDEDDGKKDKKKGFSLFGSK